MQDNSIAVATRPERPLVDLTTPLSGMLYPFLELIVATGFSWMFVGYLDRIPGQGHLAPILDSFPAFPPGTRNLVLLLWVVLVLWRFVIPLCKKRRYRLEITDRRLRIREEGLRTGFSSIPLFHVQQVSRRHSTLYLKVVGQQAPIVLRNVPKAKKVEKQLNHLNYRW